MTELANIALLTKRAFGLKKRQSTGRTPFPGSSVKFLLLLTVLFFCPLFANAQPVATVSSPKTIGTKAIMR